jgi:UDP-galactopyranose mutase
MQGYGTAVTDPVASFLSSFSFYLNYDHNQWTADVSELPAMYEVFIADSSEHAEFIDREQGIPITGIQHIEHAQSFFNQSMCVLDILEQLEFERHDYNRYALHVVLGITILDLQYSYPGLQGGRRIIRPTRTVDFYFAH